MIKKALEGQFEVKVLCDRNENALRFAYHLLGPTLLTRKQTWDRVGERIAKIILREKPDVAILITDVTAGAIPLLKRANVKVILSIEDLSAEWLKIERSHFCRILSSYACNANHIMAVSKELHDKLLDLGIESIVVKPGLEKIIVDINEALERRSSRILVNSGQIQFPESKIAFEKILSQVVDKYEILSYSGGKFAAKLQRKFPAVDWYNYPSYNEAIETIKKGSIGLLVRFRAHNPTRIYFHASMLQPVIAVGSCWTNEITDNSLGIVVDPLQVQDSIDDIFENYHTYVKAVESYANNNTLPKAYEPLKIAIGA
jgi:hypothetical protein